MEITLYSSALALGFLGSFHCAGMCGPIAMMLPQNSSAARAISGKLIYNSGRVLTYIIIGVIFGIFGFAVSIKGFQKELSIITGSIIILTIVLISINRNWFNNFYAINFASEKIRKQLKKLFSQKSILSMFLIGMINGFLPCGFVYLAVAGAASTGSIAGGAIYMALFGLGTFPMMTFISLAANFIGLRFKKIFSRVSIPIALALGVFLIYRGSVMQTENNNHHSDGHEMNCAMPVSMITGK